MLVFGKMPLEYIISIWANGISVPDDFATISIPLLHPLLFLPPRPILLDLRCIYLCKYTFIYIYILFKLLNGKFKLRISGNGICSALYGIEIVYHEKSFFFQVC